MRQATPEFKRLSVVFIIGLGLFGVVLRGKSPPKVHLKSTPRERIGALLVVLSQSSIFGAKSKNWVSGIQ